jgi:replicative DNA helicase
LREPEALNLIADKLRPDHFFLDAHRQIFEAMLELYQHNEPTDLLSVADKLRRTGGEQNEYLGPAYLVELTEAAPLAQNLEHHAHIVRDYYYLRRIIDACQSTVKKAMAFDGKVTSFIEDVEKEFLAITNDQDRAGLRPALEVLDVTLAELEKRLTGDGSMTGVPSSFVDLDRITGGWQKSDLILLAARPGMGKTAFALNVATNAVRAGKSVAVFSLEMSQSQLMMRILATESQVNASKFRSGDWTEEEQDRLMHGVRTFGTLSGFLAIDETPGINLLDLRSRCRRFKKEHGLDLVVIDYLQLMGPSGTKRMESQEREISEISGGLKALAKELQIPVLALAQLNRGPETRTDKTPQLSDLRGSGSMEQDADMIMFLYRDDYYNDNSEDAGKAKVKIAKNRHGATDEIYLAFAPHFFKFSNLHPS